VNDRHGIRLIGRRPVHDDISHRIGAVMVGNGRQTGDGVGGTDARLAIWEIVFVLVFYVALCILFMKIEFLELVHDLTRENEAWELDEILIAAILLLPSGLLLALRYAWKSRSAERQRGAALARSEAKALDLEEALAYRHRLLRQIAHDLRNPMQGVLLLVDRVRRDPSPATVVQHMDTIETSISRVAELLNRQVADLPPIAEPGPRDATDGPPVDLADVVRTAVSLHRAEADARSIAIRVDLPRTAVLAHGDAALLIRAVSNLLSNALKYGRGRPVEIALRAEGDAALIVVRDRGDGIAPDVLPLLFRPFVRGPAAGDIDGLGLGLAFVEEVVTAEGGRVAVDSVPGEGTAFTLWLPRAAG
jgi:signal transduction histidine kinase